MAVLFNNRFVGSASVLRLDGAQVGVAAPLTIEGMATGVRAFAISGITINNSVVFSLQDTISNNSWFYVFGDAATKVGIQGMVFSQLCVMGTGETVENGFDNILKYYQDNKASTRKTPIMVNFSSSGISGYLYNLTIDAQVSGLNTSLRFSMDLFGNLSTKRNAGNG